MVVMVMVPVKDSDSDTDYIGGVSDGDGRGVKF